MTRTAKTPSQQKKFVVIAGSLAVAILVSYSLYASQKETRQNAARDALFRARLVLDQDSAKLGESLRPKTETKKADAKNPAPVAPAPNADYAPADVDQAFAASVKALGDVATQFDGTRAGFDARMMLGDLYYNHSTGADAYAKASTWYESATKSASSATESASALYALGFTQEAIGKCDHAVKTFDQAIGYGEASLQGDLMKAQARCYETMGDSAKANGVYDRMITTFPGSDFAQYAQAKKTAPKAGTP